MTPTTTVPKAALDQAAARLLAAFEAGTPCSPVRDLIGSADVAAAYAVQEQVNAVAGPPARVTVVGRKIGLTSPAVQRQLGVDQPDFGVLFDDMAPTPTGRGAVDACLQPRVEAEVAFVLKADLADGDLDADQVRAAVDYAVAALEIVDSRVAGWDITFGDTVADNASGGVFVLGTDAQCRSTSSSRATSDEHEHRRRGGLHRQRRRLPRRPARRAGVAGPHRPRPRRAAAGRPGRPLRRARPDAAGRARADAVVTRDISARLGTVEPRCSVRRSRRP